METKLTALEIVNRRIAALIANGEDKRNTPAWRDANHEHRVAWFHAESARLAALAVR